MATEVKEVRIGKIGNYYGSLSLRRIGHEKYQWGVEDYSGTYWEDIPLYLVDALLKFEQQKDRE